MAYFKFFLAALALAFNLGSVMGQFTWDVPCCVGHCWSPAFNMTVKDAMQTCHRNMWDRRCLNLYCLDLSDNPDIKTCLNVECDANPELAWRIDHMVSFYGCNYPKRFPNSTESAGAISTLPPQTNASMPTANPNLLVRRESSHSVTDTASQPMLSSIVIANPTNSTPCSSIVTATVVRTATFSPNSTTVLPTTLSSTSCSCNTTTVFSTFTYTPPIGHVSSTTTVFSSNSTITMTSITTSVVATAIPHANVTYSHQTTVSTTTSTQSAPALFTDSAAAPVKAKVKIMAWWIGAVGIFIARFL